MQGGAVAACGDADSEGTGGTNEPLGSRAAAIVNGVDDVDTPEANVVVRLRSAYGTPTYQLCTGTLITSTLVLTANHCVNGSVGCGFDGASLHAVAGGSPVEIGPDLGAPRLLQPDAATPGRTDARAVQTWSLPGGPTDCGESEPWAPNNNYYDSDLALVEIYPPVVNDATGSPLAFPRVPTLAPIPTGSTVRYAGWGRDNSGGVTVFRKVGGPYFFPRNLDRDGNGDIRLRLVVDGVARGPRPGDSGGPLFLLRPDGQYDQVGVYYGGFDELPIWTNLTNDGNNTWLSAIPTATTATTPPSAPLVRMASSAAM